MEQVGVELVAKGAREFDSALNRADTSVREFGNAAETTAGRFGGLNSAIGMVGTGLAGLGIGAAVTALGALGAATFEAGEKLRQIEMILGDLGEGADMEGILAQAELLNSKFGVELEESVGAARTLVDNFGISFDEAFQVIGAGFDQGLNRSGDFLETIGEYSNQFAQGGATAEQFFSLMQSGLADGVLGTDKAADAFKEFQIRFSEGAPEMVAALDSLGLEGQQMADQFAAGELSVAEAFQAVMEGINSVEDPQARFNAGAALMGTAFEDLGTNAASEMSLLGTSMDEIAATADASANRIDSFGELFSRIMDTAVVAMAPLADSLLQLANDVFPTVQAAAQTFGALLSGEMTSIDQEAGALAQGVGRHSETVQRILDRLGRFWAAHGDSLTRIAQNSWRSIQLTIDTALSVVLGLVDAALAAIEGDWDGVLRAMGTTVQTVMNNVISQFELLGSTIASVFEMAGANIDNFIAGMSGIADAARTAVSGAAAALADLGSTISSGIPDWLIPGSPTPFEIGLRGIGRAMRDIGQADAPQFARGMQGVARVIGDLSSVITQQKPRVELENISRKSAGEALIRAAEALHPFTAYDHAGVGNDILGIIEDARELGFELQRSAAPPPPAAPPPREPMAIPSQAITNYNLNMQALRDVGSVAADFGVMRVMAGA